jgi:hypothetical protein
MRHALCLVSPPMPAATAGNRIAVERPFDRLSIANDLVSHTTARLEDWYHCTNARTNAAEISHAPA